MMLLQRLPIHRVNRKLRRLPNRRAPQQTVWIRLQTRLCQTEQTFNRPLNRLLNRPLKR
jgi:hypothetical protein